MTAKERATYARSARDVKRTLERLTTASSGELLAACLELAAVQYHSGTHRPEKINGPKDVARTCAALGNQRTESLVGLYLDAQNMMMHRQEISSGGLNITRALPREIFRPAIIHAALGVILVHNHPSGNPDPSPEDLSFTRAVKSAGDLLGIELYDHVLMAGSSYTSLRERGLL